MNYKIDKVTTAKGKIRFELRVWSRGRNSRQTKRRFVTRKEAQDFIDKAMREQSENKSGIRTFGAEYRLWREHNDSGFSPGWKANLDGYWDEAKDLLENARIERISIALEKLKSRWTKLSQKTVDNKMGFVHAVINFSVQAKRIPFNPLGAYQKPRMQPPDLEFLERHEAESLLKFLGERYPAGHSQRIRYVAPLVAINTGMRAGELWALRLDNLKTSLKTIRVVRQFNRVTKTFTQLKGKEARSVPLNAELLKELGAFANGLRPTSLVFSKNGDPIDHDSFADLFDEDIQSWGHRRITFHGLRHTFATLMLSAGIDVKSLQDIMGHKDFSTTMRYVHALGSSAQSAAERFSVMPANNVLRIADFG